MTSQVISTVSFTSVRYRTRPLHIQGEAEASIFDRFSRIPGADQDALTDAHVVLIGCGGLGSEVGHGLVRKGIGKLTLFDHDTVDITNLPRQQFGLDDVGQNKAIALARNLALQATGASEIWGNSCSFQNALARKGAVDGNIAVVGVDNNATRVEAARYYLRRNIPAIFLAVDDRAARGYVFVQTSRPNEPCFLCLFPDASEDRRIFGCAGASIEIIKVVAGIALYAIDSLLMARPRPWNYKAVFLDQGQDGQRIIAKRPRCELCG